MRRVVISAALALGLVGWLAPTAFGADSVYWTDNGNPGPIRVGNLDGTGAATSLFTGENGPEGVAIDPAAGKMYWANFGSIAIPGSGAIRVANLDGTGAADLFPGETGSEGVAIDPAAGKIYWAKGGAIRVGNLDGTGSAADLFSGENGPNGVAIDPAAGKIYWANVGSGKIRVGNLDGTGAADLFTGESNPEGVAIDPAAGKIYWASAGSGQIGSGKIRVGNLTGGAAADLFTGESYPEGVAIDPAAGKIYWGNAGSGKIRVGNLTGGTAADLFTGETNPFYVALLRSPAGAGAPVVSGGSGTGSVLSCSQGSWAPDLLGAFLFRAPHSYAYQWSLNGADIAGATSSSYTPSAPGSYGCRVTASNQAGSASQTSAAHVVSGAALAPHLTHVSQSHRRWREGNVLPHVASVRPPVGTTFRFRLNESVRVRFAFTQRLPGRRVGGRCVAPTSKNRARPACTRTVTRGRLSFSVGQGAHRVRFDGRISKHKKLKPGRYTLVITATNVVGQRATARLTFMIVKG